MGSDATGTNHTLSFPDAGSGKLVLEFTGANVTSGITDQLLAPDGTSLYGLNPPAGSGQTSAIAEGGSGGVVNVDEPTANTHR